MAKLQQALQERVNWQQMNPQPSETLGPTVSQPSIHALAAEEATQALLSAANADTDIAAAVDLPQPSFDDIVTDDAPRTVKSGGRSK
jgi:hypothetical protein